MNLFINLVLKKDFLANKYITIHVVGLLYALIPNIALAANGGIASIGYKKPHFWCQFSVTHAKAYYLWPLAVVGWIGITITLVTVGNVIYLLTLAPSQTIQSQQHNGPIHKNELHSESPKWISFKKSSAGVGESSTSYHKMDLDSRASSSRMETKKISQVELVGRYSQASVAKSENRKTSLFADTPVHTTGDTIAGASKLTFLNKPTFEPNSHCGVANQAKKKINTGLAIIKKSYRALLICVTFVAVFCSFWIVNWTASDVWLQVSSSTPPDWVQDWFVCGLSGNAQEDCAALVADVVPAFDGFATANILAPAVGIAVFVIFWSGFVADWKELLGFKNGNK
ncbi:hypothetical protein HK100_001243 [Physocladia obscura]|uniref:Uncharacterized protein n=1 Tax=Physocladia obscura TaxID=109957 RepID=A0AAD5T7X0_9FUNG|nr:hypothetical protein HK100_001243 [Physocladia obscura]